MAHEDCTGRLELANMSHIFRGILVIGRDFGDMIKELRYCSTNTSLQLVSGTVCRQ